MKNHNKLDKSLASESLIEWQPPSYPLWQDMKGRFCRLEPLQADRHAQALYTANITDKEAILWQYLPYGPFPGFGEYYQWMEDTCSGNDPMFFAIIDLASETALGVASYLRIVPTHGCIEVGHINYSPLLQNTAAATEAMYLMMKHVFELGYRRYEWKCNALNQASRNAALRLGFSFEGIFRQALVVKGQNRDTAWFSIIDKEWPALQVVLEQWLDPSNFNQNGEQNIRLSELTSALSHSTASVVP